ncbi:DUF5719 family protein [Microbacterium hominis]|uniref:Large extracellular alpha-helical protein n=1 Tax=Microbacterium hominis TaxID=162426 RepID=A0A7D4U5A7_9MICO|nr:DUF5719 family protein [Microbacterium hominis]QKJ20005.1 large extracellular alpha-helical protein [Microbacterium hominis]
MSRPERTFRWATNGTRMMAGTVVATVAVVGVVTGVSIPWPTVSRDPVAVSAVPAPAATVLACTGGLMVIGRDVEDAQVPISATRQVVTMGTEAGAPEPVETRLVSPAEDADEGAAVFTAPPTGRQRVDLAASGSSTITADDISGYSASACRPPLLESWLVGGSASTGAADLVLISNPGQVAATVQLTVYSADGGLVPPGGGDVIVRAGEQLAVPLAGLVLGEESPVVRVSAVGAPVQASLQTSATQVLTPIGADQVGPAVGPETRQVITGITVLRSPREGSAGAATRVRVLAPDADTTATIVVRSVGRGGTQPDPITVPLSAGVPTEVSVGDLSAGTYTVEVSGEDPVVAGVWHTTGFEKGDDFAWYAPAPLIERAALFAVPVGPSATLSLVNPTDEVQTVALSIESGAFSTELTVAAGGTTTARLSPRTVYRLQPSGEGVRASVSLAADGALSGFPVWPVDAAAPPITVYP